MLVVRGGTVVDADGAREADVAVEDGTITAVGDAPDDPDREIDATDQFVAPGLIDAHVHLMMDGRADPGTLLSDTSELSAYRAAANLEAALSAGVTSVRDLGAQGTVALDAADAVEDGIVDGPTVQAAGQSVVMTGGHGNWFGREADGRAEIKKAVREQLKRGADVIKCIATGGVLTEGALTGAPELGVDELRAVVETANAKHVPTAAHAHGTEGIKNAVEAGISSVEHATYMDREAAERMADRGTYWVPTASALHGIVEQDDGAGIPTWAVEKARDAADAFEDAFEHALEAGVPIAMGTDAGTPFNRFADIPKELELLVEYGLTPEEALEAATVNAADLLGLDDAGSVSEGCRADVLILEEDPRDDVTVWQSPSRIIASGSTVR